MSLPQPPQQKTYEVVRTRKPRLARTRARSRSRARYLHQLMPVLDGFAWIPQHGRPVLPPGAVGVAAHATHPDDLVMADADVAVKEEGEQEGERERMV